ncbi:MAG: hypothetical protein IPM25_07725 [Chloracidobacterium sp.]|nr:hypothetical protein [Chloracidobacterium sp.]
MNKSFWMRRSISACIIFAIVSTTSMVALASPGRMIAELTVSGKPVNGEPPFVFVNGEQARSGRSVFSSSTVSTTEDTSAIVGIGKSGRIELAPNSTANLIFDDKSVEAELTSGQLTVQGSLGTVKVRTKDGKTTILNAGESITASGEGRAARQTGSSDYWWVWVLVAGGAAAAIIIALSQSSDGNVASTNR